MAVLFFVISFGASIIGAISGIGGGVIIKPLLDGISSLSVSSISFLSGTTVLSMTTVALIRNRKSTVSIDFRCTSMMAVGGVAGGLSGKFLFDTIKAVYGNDQIIGITQSIILFLISGAVLLFSLAKGKIQPHRSRNRLFSAAVGFMLGGIASFLGIGGGPINLAVLYYFFSMNTRTAAINSIFIIFFSQLTSLIFSLAAGTIPPFDPAILLIMIAGGIGGGWAGSHLAHRMSDRSVDYLFISVITAIMLLCIYNTIKWIG